jgi:DNA repair protein RecO (recombination protein O)
VPRARAYTKSRSHQTRALVLQRVAYGESDWILQLFTEQIGRVSALARGARRSQRRFGGSLEPIHTLLLQLEERDGSALLTLRDAGIDVVRSRITTDLDRLRAAGRALGWVRGSVPERTPEPGVWQTLHTLLDRLDSLEDPGFVSVFTAEFGLSLLCHMGWAIEFEQCVRCGRQCPAGQSAMVDAARGGLICRACGGARLQIDGSLRARLVRAAQGESGVLSEPDAPRAMDLVEQGLLAHMGIG